MTKPLKEKKNPGLDEWLMILTWLYVWGIYYIDMLRADLMACYLIESLVKLLTCEKKTPDNFDK